jgi:hypothetical protein
VVHELGELLQHHVSHFMKRVIAVREELVNHLGTGDVVEVRPVCKVGDSVLIALDCGAIVLGAIPQLVCLEPVGRNPRCVAGLDVKLHQRWSIGAIYVLVEDFYRQPAVQNVNDGVCIAVVVDGTTVVHWPYLQDIRDAWGAAAVAPECDAQVRFAEISELARLGLQLLVQFAIWPLKTLTDGVGEPVLGRLWRPVQVHVWCSDIEVKLLTGGRQAGRKGVVVVVQFE